MVSNKGEINTRLKGFIGYNFQTTKSGIAYIVLNKETIKSLNVDYNYASAMVNTLSGMKGYPVWCSFAESENGLVRVELRSKNFNVQQIAIKFNGGGHLKASGCKLENINDYKKVIEALEDMLRGE